MKYLTMSLVSVAISALQIAIPAPADAEIHGGVMAGGSLSWLDPPGVLMSTERYADITEGAFLSMSIGSRITIQPSVVLSRRGGTYPRMSSYPSGEDAEFRGADYRIDYYEFPLLVRYCIVQGSCVRPELIVGPAWCSIRKSRVESPTYRSGEWARGYDTALFIGFGVSAWAGEALFGIDVLYRAPMTSPSDNLLFPEAAVEGVSVLMRVGI
ncbi:MAG: hypothetical protein Q7U75_08585 [Desulfobacterales bacterium]|nr:hypothetical protein [Desulfobacterales bacterium]